MTRHAEPPLLAAQRSPASARLRVLLRGTVQGMGFRPAVYRLATAAGLTGWVGNAAAGLLMEVEGGRDALERFLAELSRSAPAQARVDSMETQSLPVQGEQGFTVLPTAGRGDGRTGVLPDMAPCSACLDELLDPGNRRYRYPFTSCTSCGPRFSVMLDQPYDRELTTMARFPMCAECMAEYADPANRRFHSEINACPNCGPAIAFATPGRPPSAFREAALAAAVAMLRQGRILALKGLGGYQLLVDGGNELAVVALRERKRRPEKPFALLVADLGQARRLGVVGPGEATLLRDAAAPIVLLPRGTHARVANAVAPGNPWLGIMLPATPLHHLLARDFGGPLVATSGNLAEAPLLYDEDAPHRLTGLADALLIHDRVIAQPVDDSVARIVAGRTMVLRCGRGYAPVVIAQPGARPGVLGAGGHLKTTVAVTVRDQILVGPHVGDMDSPESRQARVRSVALMQRLAGTDGPAVLARDLHADYAPCASWSGLRVQRTLDIPHHVAHVAACMAEHGLRGPVLGVAWDGAGAGPDGTLWGGEFLLVDGLDYQRVAHFRLFRLPGGDAAIREGWRAALGLLFAIRGDAGLDTATLPCLSAMDPDVASLVIKALRKGLNAPLTSSAGRLFDAVAALLGLRVASSYEGQAAAAVESVAADPDGQPGYGFALSPLGVVGPTVVDFAPAVAALIHDRDQGIPTGRIARRWHDGLAGAVVAVARRHGIGQVALAGGCFQNRVLLEAAASGLSAAGFRPVWPERIPPNDGGLSLGQVAWASRQLQGAA